MLDVIIRYLKVAFLRDLKRHEIDPVLGEQFKDLHLFIDLHVAVLSTHAPVEKLIEVDVAIVALDGHLEHLLLQLAWLVIVLSETKGVGLVAIFSKDSEELRQLLLLDLETSILFLSLCLPDAHETVEVPLEKHYHVIFGQVVFLELLNDDKDEQIKHHMSAHEDQEEEIQGRNSKSLATCLALNAAVGLGATAIKHDFVPIFACRDSKEQYEGRREVLEVLQVIDDVSARYLCE